jgi:hypothetical protein
MPNFQNNFATNLTTGTTSGETSSPINSIPTVDAPYYIAFDATNINSHYEVVLVTSDTATNVLHAGTVYDHTTAEEVRIVVPATHLNTMQNFPEGFLINGKISPTVASNNLTVAIKTLAGTDPSATDPVYVMIGGVMRSITSALFSKYDAGVNWCNAGSAELATKEIDYFVHIGFSTGTLPGVRVGFSRIPYATLISDFSATATNEKFTEMAFGTYSNTTDTVVNIGRFAATLSAGAGYTWSVPTFTSSNLIQRPIYETRNLSWTPVYTSGGTMTFTPTTIGNNTYKIVGTRLFYSNNVYGTTGGTTNTTIRYTVPFGRVSTFAYEYIGSGQVYDNTYFVSSIGFVDTNSNLISASKSDGSNWTITTNRQIFHCANYEI